METTKAAEGNFFEQFGLELTAGEVEVGKTYPLFGMVTKFLDTTGTDDVKVEINHHIVAKMFINDPKKVELLKQRAFETGIFISTVVAKEPTLEVECQTVIFGRPQAYHA